MPAPGPEPCCVDSPKSLGRIKEVMVAAKRMDQATKEIENILKKHDLAGAIILSDGHSTEWNYSVQTSWSIALVDPWTATQSFVKFKADVTNYPDPALRKRAIDLTSKMIRSIRDTSLNVSSNFSKMVAILELALESQVPPIKPEDRQ